MAKVEEEEEEEEEKEALSARRRGGSLCWSLGRRPRGLRGGSPSG